MSEIESCITSFVDGRVRLRHPSETGGDPNWSADFWPHCREYCA
ncbi:MAG: hypothetical protein ACLUPV_12515 [Bilophila wadsworthia]